MNKAIEEEKKALAPKKAAIAFTYTEEPDEEIEERPGSANADSLPDGVEEPVAEGSDDDSDSDIDLGEEIVFFSTQVPFFSVVLSEFNKISGFVCYLQFNDVFSVATFLKLKKYSHLNVFIIDPILGFLYLPEEHGSHIELHLRYQALFI